MGLFPAKKFASRFFSKILSKIFSTCISRNLLKHVSTCASPFYIAHIVLYGQAIYAKDSLERNRGLPKAEPHSAHGSKIEEKTDKIQKNNSYHIEEDHSSTPGNEAVQMTIQSEDKKEILNQQNISKPQAGTDKVSADPQIIEDQNLNKEISVKKISQRFPNIELVDENGRKVKFFDDLVKDHIVMINFIFTKCQKFCPAETARLRRVQRALGSRMGNDIFFISVSIDPQNDSPAVLKEYKKKFDLGPGWSFLTGNENEIKDLRTKLGLLSMTFSEEKSDHSLDILVGNESTGKWMRRSSMDSPEVLAKLIGENLANWSQSVSPRVDFSLAPMRTHKGTPGEDLFRQKCLDCHSLGGGDGIGPDLVNVTSIRDSAWLRNWIKNPDRMLAEKDPVATALLNKFNKLEMPNLGITDSEVDDIILFIAQKSKEITEKK